MKQKKVMPDHAFHITRRGNLASIGEHGLLPLIGPLSKLAEEKEPRVYLFTSIDDAETALMNWLGDIFEEAELSLLMIETDGLDLEFSAGYELTCSTSIPPAKITVIADDVDEINSLQAAYVAALKQPPLPGLAAPQRRMTQRG